MATYQEIIDNIDQWYKTNGRKWITGLIGNSTFKQVLDYAKAHIDRDDNPHGVTKAQLELDNVTNEAQIPLTQKGAANGVATLGADGKLPAGQYDFEFACSDEASDLEVGTVFKQRILKAFTITSILAGVTVAPTGANLIMDIKKNGTSVLSTLLSIDAGETTSTTAATPVVISGGSATFAVGDLFEVAITQIGSTVAGSGLKLMRS